MLSSQLATTISATATTTITTTTTSAAGAAFTAIFMVLLLVLLLFCKYSYQFLLNYIDLFITKLWTTTAVELLILASIQYIYYHNLQQLSQSWFPLIKIDNSTQLL